MTNSSVHVIRNTEGGWSVRKGGAVRAFRSYSTEQEAINNGRTLAQKESSEFFIHRADGMIRERKSYGRSEKG